MTKKSAPEAATRLVEVLLDCNQVDPTDYQRRKLPEDVFDELANSSDLGIDLKNTLIAEIGLIDLPTMGEQKPLHLHLRDSPVWFFGPRSSGRTHALRCVLGEICNRYPESNVIVFNAALGSTVIAKASSSDGPLIVDGGDLLSQGLILEQIHRRYFLREEKNEHLVLLIDRVDKLSRSLAVSETSSAALAEIVLDGVSRGVSVVMTADAPVRNLVSSDAQEFQLRIDPDQTIPSVLTDAGRRAAIFPVPQRSKECGSAEFYGRIGVPPLPIWDHVKTEASTNRRIVLGVDWVTHEQVAAPRESIMIAGSFNKKRRSDLMMAIARLYVLSNHFVVQIRAQNDHSWSAVDGPNIADLSISLPTRGNEIVSSILKQAGRRPVVILFPSIDRHHHKLEDQVTLRETMAAEQWILIASSQDSAWRNSATRMKYLTTFQFQLWTSPSTARSGMAADAPRLTVRAGAALASDEYSLYCTPEGVRDILVLDPHHDAVTE